MSDSTMQHAAEKMAAQEDAAAKAAAAAPGAVLVAPHSEHVAHALARMQASRARLRMALLPKETRPETAGKARSGGGFKVADIGKLVWRQFRGQFKQSPSLAVVADTVQQWWKRQPWVGAASMVGGELRDAVVPVVRRHPWMAVGAAATLGAVVMTARPWRWSLVTGQFRKLRSEALRTLRYQAFHVPLQMLLASLASLLVVQTSSTDDAAAPPPGDAPPPDPV